MSTDNTEHSKDTLLHFASSELTSHAGSLLALSVILFTYLSIIFPNFQMSFDLYSAILFKPTFDYIVIFLIFWVLNSGIIFTAMRLIFYGAYAHAIIVFPEDKDREKLEAELAKINKKRKELKENELIMNDLNIKHLRDLISTALKEEKFLGIIPYNWFSSGISERKSGGLVFSFALGFLVSKILFFVFLVK